MSRCNIKETVIFLAIMIASIILAYLITYSLGIQNTIIFHSIIYGDVPFEALIFLFLALIGAIIYNRNFEDEF